MEGQRWGRMQGREERSNWKKRQCVFIWIWNQLESLRAISSSVLRELFIRMTFTVKVGGGREVERKAERGRKNLRKTQNKRASGEMDKWHEPKKKRFNPNEHTKISFLGLTCKWCKVEVGVVIYLVLNARSHESANSNTITSFFHVGWKTCMCMCVQVKSRIIPFC